jgi:hypothetical protein
MAQIRSTERGRSAVDGRHRQMNFDGRWTKDSAARGTGAEQLTILCHPIYIQLTNLRRLDKFRIATPCRSRGRGNIGKLARLPALQISIEALFLSTNARYYKSYFSSSAGPVRSDVNGS